MLSPSWPECVAQSSVVQLTVHRNKYYVFYAPLPATFQSRHSYVENVTCTLCYSSCRVNAYGKLFALHMIASRLYTWVLGSTVRHVYGHKSRQRSVTDHADSVCGPAWPDLPQYHGGDAEVVNLVRIWRLPLLTVGHGPRSRRPSPVDPCCPLTIMTTA